MGRQAHFKVAGRIDNAPGATVTIDRDLGLFAVRPLRRRKTYELPLSVVAEMVLHRVVMADKKLTRKRR